MQPNKFQMEKCSVLIDWKNLFCQNVPSNTQVHIFWNLNRPEESSNLKQYEQNGRHQVWWPSSTIKQKGNDVCTDTDQWKRTEQPDTKSSVCGYLMTEVPRTHNKGQFLQWIILHGQTWKAACENGNYHVILNKHENKDKCICHPKVRWEAIQSPNDTQRL